MLRFDGIIEVGTITVDDIYPAVPIIRNIP